MKEGIARATSLPVGRQVARSTSFPTSSSASFSVIFVKVAGRMRQSIWRFTFHARRGFMKRLTRTWEQYAALQAQIIRASLRAERDESTPQKRSPPEV